MRTYALSAQELARRLVTSSAAENGVGASNARATQVACERACHDLSRSLGSAGFNALLTRALMQAEAAHPCLKGVRIGRGGEPMLAGIEAITAEHGAAAVDAGLEAMLATMLGLLGRLIGDDLVPRLLEASVPDHTHDDKDVK